MYGYVTLEVIEGIPHIAYGTPEEFTAEFPDAHDSTDTEHGIYTDYWNCFWDMMDEHDLTQAQADEIAHSFVDDKYSLV